jgi:hypothetical protein
MKPTKTLLVLSVLIAVLAAIAAGLGLFWQEGESAFSFTKLETRMLPCFNRGMKGFLRPGLR